MQLKNIFKKNLFKIISLILVLAFCMTVVQGVFSPTMSPIKLTAEKQDFLNTLKLSYQISGHNVVIEDYNENYAVVKVTDNNDTVKRHLFDLNKEIVAVSNFTGRINKNNKKVVFAETQDKNENSYVYDDNGRLLSINRPSLKYSFTYDENGNLTEKYINSEKILERKFNSYGKVEKEILLNGDVIDYFYKENNCIAISLNGKVFASYSYENDKLVSYLDVPTNTYYKYSYNEDKVNSMISNNGYKIDYFYDSNDEIIKRIYYLDNEMIDLNIYEEGVYSTDYITSNKTDIADRITSSKLDTKGFNYINNYEYVVYEPIPEELTEENWEEYYNNISYDNRISKVTNNFCTYDYTYDAIGNVTDYRYADNHFNFKYDDKSQLIEYVINENLQKVEYDSSGNILSKDGIKYIYGTGFEQDWLVKFGEEEFKYDEIGNPVIYRNKNLEWNGKNLSRFEDIHFTYNKAGVRSSQTANGQTTYYFTEGKKVIFEKTNEKIITYLYEDSDIIGLRYNNKNYYYVKNVQKDIIGIFDENGNLAVEYIYDPWGKTIKIDGIMADTLGIDNPYRYRSYRYDNCTGLYYLISRYYDPETGRFINADDTVNLTYTILSDDLGKNLYTYCNNNPFNMSDPNGTMGVKALNLLKTIYSDLKWLPDDCISTPVLILNGGNIYNAFHETAQLVAAKRLSELYYSTELEYRTFVGEADIKATAFSKNYLYEVKPITVSDSVAINQLAKYLSATKYLAGPFFDSYEIDYLPFIKMVVSTNGKGIVTYKFFKEINVRFLWYNKQVKKEITETNLKTAIQIGYWAGVVIAGGIIIATIAEDVITCGAGIVDDIPSVITAAKGFRIALKTGLAFA